MIPPVLLAKLRRDGELTLWLKATPGSSRDEVSGQLEDGTLKVKVTAAPEKGKANEAVCVLLAGEFGVPKSHVEIVSGETSHRKQARVWI